MKPNGIDIRRPETFTRTWTETWPEGSRHALMRSDSMRAFHRQRVTCQGKDAVICVVGSTRDSDNPQEVGFRMMQEVVEP